MKSGCFAAGLSIALLAGCRDEDKQPVASHTEHLAR